MKGHRSNIAYVLVVLLAVLQPVLVYASGGARYEFVQVVGLVALAVALVRLANRRVGACEHEAAGYSGKDPKRPVIQDAIATVSSGAAGALVVGPRYRRSRSMFDVATGSKRVCRVCGRAFGHRRRQAVSCLGPAGLLPVGSRALGGVSPEAL